MGRLVPARDAVALRPGGAGGDPVARGVPSIAARKGDALLIPLTVPEVRVLLLRVVWARLTPPERTLAWSDWRRAHQQHAREYHYNKRQAKPP